MVLATMEMENNLKLSIHEMLFKLHLEKADLPVFLLSDAERNGRTAPEDHAAACLARPLSAELLRESLSGVLQPDMSGLQQACV